MRFVDIFFQTFSTLRLAYPTAQINTQCLVAQRREVFPSPYWLKYVPKLVNTHEYCHSRRMNTQRETIMMFKTPRLLKDVLVNYLEPRPHPADHPHDKKGEMHTNHTNIYDIDFVKKKFEAY